MCLVPSLPAFLREVNILNPVADAYPSFQLPEFLEGHAERTLEFYRENATDPEGGFFHCLNDDGSIYDNDLRHLVSSCRFVFNFAKSAARTGNTDDKALAEHGLAYLESAHRKTDGSYIWEMRAGKVTDPAIMGYGHAFVLLAAACAIKAGISTSRTVLSHVWSFMESRFWDPEHGAYIDEFTAGFAQSSDYRGQNVNMHMCEACIAAWQATGDENFLNKAIGLAHRFAGELADLGGGAIWEHYTKNWSLDFEYNKALPNDLFRPWGYQPGHQFEWARLLLILDEIRPNPSFLTRAASLYETAMTHGRDERYGGIFYGYAPDGSPCAEEKYYWVHSEAVATAWRLYARTGKSRYQQDYNDLWRYSWDHFVDHEHGAWFRILHRDGTKIDSLKSPPGKTDYHTLGVCWDILSVMNAGAV